MSLGAINLNKLVYLKALLTERHVSRAAQKVGLSQSGMSHILKELRYIFQDPLLVRGEKGWIPTEKALLILDQIEEGLDHLDRVVANNIPFSPEKEHRRFRIICNDYVGVVIIPEILRRLRSRYPGISLELLPWSSVSDSALVESVDLVLGFYQESLPEKFHEELLFEDSYWCMISTTHPRIKESLTLDQFLAEEHVIVREQDGAIGVVNAALQSMNKTRKITVEVSSFLMFPFLLAQTDLVITTTSRNINIFEKILPIRAVACPLALPKVSIKQVWHTRTQNSPAHQWLRAIISEISKTV